MSKTTTIETAPSFTPPADAGAGSGNGAGAPTLSFEETVSEGFAQAIDEPPTQTPPTETAAIEAEEEGIAAWHNGKKITALWSDHHNRNSWIAIQGMGWKKLATKNDSSLVSLTIIAAHAEQTGATVNVRIESDKRVHEIYAW